MVKFSPRLSVTRKRTERKAYESEKKKKKNEKKNKKLKKSKDIGGHL